jgi:sodium/hydrogen antiporter
VLIVLIFGVVLLFAVLLSSIAQRSVLSTAVIFLVAGFVGGRGVLGLMPTDDGLVQRFAELALFSILFTDGMRLTAGSLRQAWRLPGRALLIGLPATLVAVALLAHGIVGVRWPDAWLLGAALSPTDPVFAAAIIGEERVPQRLRELLNVESGLNDGLALPIVVGLLAVYGAASTTALQAGWHALLGVGVGIGVPALAVLLNRSYVFAVSEEYAPIGAFAVALLVFSIGRTLAANEFLGAFAAGVTLASLAPRARERFQPMGEPLAEILKLAALLLFGALIQPELFVELGVAAWIFTALVLVAARPLAIFLSLLGTDLSRRETMVVGWFGPKGFASVFFAFLILQSGMRDATRVFHLIALVIAASIVAHSSTDVIVARLFADPKRGG